MLEITLPSDVEAQLETAAKNAGISSQEYFEQLIERSLKTEEEGNSQ